MQPQAQTKTESKPSNDVAMPVPKPGWWTVTVDLLRAAKDAGFIVTPTKIDDFGYGYGYGTRLSYKRKPFMVTSDCERGGPPHLFFAAGRSYVGPDATGQCPQHAILATLLSLPEVKAFREYRDSRDGRNGGSVYAHGSTDEVAGILMAMADLKRTVASVRKSAGRLSYVVGDVEVGHWTEHKEAPNTPELRRRVVAQFPERFQNFQGWLPDMLEGL